MPDVLAPDFPVEALILKVFVLNANGIAFREIHVAGLALSLRDHAFGVIVKRLCGCPRQEREQDSDRYDFFHESLLDLILSYCRKRATQSEDGVNYEMKDLQGVSGAWVSLRISLECKYLCKVM